MSVFHPVLLGMVSDEQIIGGCIDGKRKAFNLLYRKYSAVLLGVCMRYSNSRDDAEDILQDGFIKIFTRIRNFRGEGSFEGWMRRIMINTAIDHYQQHLKLHFLRNVEEAADESSIAEHDGDGSSFPSGMDISQDTLMDFHAIDLQSALELEYNLVQDEIGYDWKDVVGDVGSGNVNYVIIPDINYVIRDWQGFYYKVRFVNFYNNAGEKGYPTFEMQKL